MTILGTLVDYVAGRLTLTSGTPVTTADVTAAATLYFALYKGDRIALYDTTSTNWKFWTFTERSLSLAGYTADKNYDIWLYNNAGTLTLDSTIWTDDSTRATALTTQNGVYVKTADASRRYLGTIRITAAGAQCEDSVTKRFVWNYNNRVSRRLYLSVSGVDYDYGTQTWRSVNADTANRFGVVVGVSEDAQSFYGMMRCLPDAAGSAAAGMHIAWGLDSTTTPVTGCNQAMMLGNSGINIQNTLTTHYVSPLVAGYHFLQFLEKAALTANAKAIVSAADNTQMQGTIYG